MSDVLERVNATAVRYRTGWVPAVVAFAIIGLPVVVTDPAQRFLMGYVAIVCILSVSLHVLMGMAGQFSLGQAAIFGSGAYASAWFVLETGASVILALVVAAVVGVLVGCVMGTVAARTTELYLALATLAFGFVAESLVRNSETLGGAQGLRGFDYHVFGQSLLEPVALYWCAAAVLLLAMAIAASVRRGRLGRALMALRDGPVAARSVGIDTRVVQLLVFAVSGAFIAMAGALYPAYALTVDPSVFSIDLTLVVLTAAAVAGVRSMPSVLVLTIAMTVFRHQSQSWGLASYVLLIYGVLVVLMLRFMPEGIAGIGARITRWATRNGGDAS